MRAAILGATGTTGQLLLQQALDAGHQVVALVRDPAKITIKVPQLTVEKADVFDADSLAPHLTGCEVVFSCLGAYPSSPFQTISLYSTTIKSITDAMKSSGVSRLVAITSWCTVRQRGNPFFLEYVFKPLLYGRVFADAARMESYVETQASDINYTIVRPPFLRDDPINEKNIMAVEGQFVPNALDKIPRANVAKFMLDCVATDTWDRKMVAIALPK